MSKRSTWEQAQAFVLEFHPDARPVGRIGHDGHEWWAIAAKGLAAHMDDEAKSHKTAWRKAAKFVAEGQGAT